MGHEPSTAPGVSPKLNCSCPALPQSRNCAAMRRSSLAWPAPIPAGFKSQPITQKHINRSAMLGQCTLLLVLLALLALAQQHSPGNQGTALTFPASPHRALQGRWTPTAPPKAGECPVGTSGAPWPPRLYCLSDHACPGAEKCCQIRKVWTCLLPSTGTAAHSKGCQRKDRASGGMWAGACVGAQSEPCSLGHGCMEHLPLQRARATAPVLAVPSGQAVGQDVTTTPHATRGRSAAPAAAAPAACLLSQVRCPGDPHARLRMPWDSPRGP